MRYVLQTLLLTGTRHKEVSYTPHSLKHLTGRYQTLLSTRRKPSGDRSQSFTRTFPTVDRLDWRGPDIAGGQDILFRTGTSQDLGPAWQHPGQDMSRVRVPQLTLFRGLLKCFYNQFRLMCDSSCKKDIRNKENYASFRHL